jgi:hypothetical protein
MYLIRTTKTLTVTTNLKLQKYAEVYVPVEILYAKVRKPSVTARHIERIEDN